MSWLMKTLRRCAGQSIVEYLLLVAMIILAAVAGINAMRPGVESLYTNAATKANTAATSLDSLTVP